jgi:hypothetical protein
MRGPSQRRARRLWFILHYENQTAHIERHPAQARSKELTKCKKILTTKALEDLAEISLTFTPKKGSRLKTSTTVYIG